MSVYSLQRQQIMLMPPFLAGCQDGSLITICTDGEDGVTSDVRHGVCLPVGVDAVHDHLHGGVHSTRQPLLTQGGARSIAVCKVQCFVQLVHLPGHEQTGVYVIVA